jgi:lipopolysaccharide transport system ATP-binding protein
MSVVISVEDISKQYRLGQVGRRTLSHDFNRWYHRVRGKEDPYLKIGQENDRTTKSTSDYVWSLRDINFQVREGEVLGIIGRNGAGKSTLLKILSKVTAPTKGEVKIAGRTASLLEVGTGFHPDLTGRDNIFLNGAILGMTKQEIRSKFDEIVDFAGVERYIDTPVKRYSSGMYVRLAFAVAAHLEPDILIVDEVLAVGDAEFQKKCLGKMKDVSVKEGRTVLFVSHQLGSVSQLCTEVLLLNNGRLKMQGNTDEVIRLYLDEMNTTVLSEFNITDAVKQGKQYYFENIHLEDTSGNTVSSVGTEDEILICGSIVRAGKKVESAEIAISVMDKKKNRIFTIHESLQNLLRSDEHSGMFKIAVSSNFLAPGAYSIIAALHIPHIQLFHLVEDTCMFTIIDAGSNLADHEGTDYGVVIPRYSIQF